MHLAAYLKHWLTSLIIYTSDTLWHTFMPHNKHRYVCIYVYKTRSKNRL